MAISQAKLEANRRNAQKSTGPRTEEGKELEPKRCHARLSGRDAGAAGRRPAGAGRAAGGVAGLPGSW